MSEAWFAGLRQRRVCLQEGVQIYGLERLDIGSCIHIGRGTVIQADGGVRIGNHVVISFDCVLWSVDHDYQGELLPYDFRRIGRPIVIEDNVWLGRNVMVRGGVRIGEGAVVAMGAVVVDDVPGLAVVAGNPARVVKYRDAEGYASLKSAGQTLWSAEPDGCPACESSRFFLELRTPAGNRGWWSRWRSRLKRLLARERIGLETSK